MPEITQEYKGTVIVPAAGTFYKGILDKSCWGESLSHGKKSNRKQMAAIYRWIDSVAATISKENRITGSASDMHLSLAADVGFRAPRFQSLRMPVCKELPDVRETTPFIHFGVSPNTMLVLYK